MIKQLPTMDSAVCGEADATVFHLMEGKTKIQRGRAVSEGGDKLAGQRSTSLGESHDMEVSIKGL